MEQLILDNKIFIYYLFNITAGGLQALSLVTGLSYQWWNIVIWFGILPAVWIYMISKKTSPWINLLSVALFITMFSLSSWNKWFDQAVVLLNDLCTLLGPDYREMSVYICLFAPAFITILLGSICLSKRPRKLLNIFFLASCLLIIIGFPVSNYFLSKCSGQLKGSGQDYEKMLKSFN